MSWFTSIFIALVTGAAGAAAAGYVAALAVHWYRIPAREGGSGYFIVLMGLIGLVVGVIAGLVVSRRVAGGAQPGFFKALGYSLLPVLGTIAVIGGAARLRADVPPRLDGEELLLAVEVRWPEGHATSPAEEPGEWRLRLAASSGHVSRINKKGPLWKEDAHLVDGRWVVPGAVEIFTARGDRILDVLPDGVIANGFVIPLPAYPGEKALQWSDWYPHARPGEPPLPDGHTYRFKVVPRSQPIRADAFGPFEIRTIAESFDTRAWGDQPATWSAAARFAILYRGQPVVIERRGAVKDPDTVEDPNARYERADAVATIPGPRPALLVQVDAPYTTGHAYLLVDDGGRLSIEYVAYGEHALDMPPLTADTAVFEAHRGKHAPRGRIDRTTYARGGLYLFNGAVLDTRSLAVRRFAAHRNAASLDSVPPLALSPDERSFVRVDVAAGSSDAYVLAVTDTLTRETYALPIDQARTRFAAPDRLDPAWVAHYFRWDRDAGGVDRLVAREGVAPLPYRGILTSDGSGYREYRIQPARESLRGALVEFLAAEFKGDRQPAEAGAYAHEVRIDGRAVSVAYDTGDHHVGVFMDRGGDSQLVAAIAERFDAAVASGAYDRHFMQ